MFRLARHRCREYRTNQSERGRVRWNIVKLKKKNTKRKVNINKAMRCHRQQQKYTLKKFNIEVEELRCAWKSETEKQFVNEMRCSYKTNSVITFSDQPNTGTVLNMKTEEESRAAKSVCNVNAFKSIQIRKNKRNIQQTHTQNESFER